MRGFVGMLMVVAWACHAPPQVQSPAPGAPVAAPGEGPIRVAVTVDDLPRHGPLPPGTAATAAVREHLAVGGYRIAQVTIDFYDWAFNAPYVRCLQLGDQEAIAALRRTFVQHAVRMLQWSDAAARQIWGRSVPHVLVLHVGAFDAEMIDDLLTAYERLGVEWITLEDALDNPIYADLPTAPKVTQGTLIENVIEARVVEHPPWPEHPEALLAVVCPVPLFTSE